jgi:putative transposase
MAACRLMGISRATRYRRCAPPPARKAPVPQKERPQPAALTDQERARIEAFLTERVPGVLPNVAAKHI